MGTYDPTLVHVQLALLAFGFLLGFVSLLRDRVPLALVGASALAVLSAEPVLKQLSTGLADVPLAFFVALGLARHGPLARFRGALGARGRDALPRRGDADEERGPLLRARGAARARSVRVGAAAASSGSPPARWSRSCCPGGCSSRSATFPSSSTGSATPCRPHTCRTTADRVGPAVRGLGSELLSGDWGLLVPLFLVAVVAAVLAGRYALAGFAVLWTALAFGGLVLVYWISTIPVELALVWSGDRTIVTVVIGAAALAPLLAGAAWASRGGAGETR